MNKKRGKKLMMIFISVIILLIVGVIIFFKVPYSSTKSEFNKINNEIISETFKTKGVFTEEDIKTLPLPVQKYFRYCGFIGTPKMSYMRAIFNDVNFKMPDKDIIIDYTQYNFANKPHRIALIDSSLFGIPFEGLDSYRDGIGSMKGTIAKMITLFDQRGENMDKASLATMLSECLIIPTVAISDYIKWEEIDDTHAKATMSYYGTSASGIFTFDANGAMLSFRTKDRVSTDMDGKTREAEWSAVILDYQNSNGLNLPKTLQAIWHYPEGDKIYFNENMSPVKIEYDLPN